MQFSRKIIQKIATVLLLCLICILPIIGQMEAKVDALFERWDNEDSPAVSVAVTQNGAIIYKNAFGMANLEYDIQAKPSTIFHIASVSKQFTAFAILLLEQEGKLSLDDDIRKFIPEVPDFGEKITLRHLASHTSGMRDQWNLLAMAGWRLDDVITKEHVLKLISKQKELNFKPGSEYTYCNTGFTLLAEVVARVSGKTFAEYTAENIFEPLGMDNTLFYDDHEKIVKNRAYSYYYQGSELKKSVLSYANVGATSLFTTVEDLSLWALNFNNPKVGNQEIFETMNNPYTLNNGETFGGALGQFVGKYKGLNEIQHGGADAGFRSYFTRFPDQEFSVALFSNDASINTSALSHKIVDIYLKDKFKAREELQSEVDEEGEDDDDKEIKVDEETLSSYVGKYELQPGFIIKVTLENGQLSGQATGQSPFRFKALSTAQFYVEGADAKVTFIATEGDFIDILRLNQGGRLIDAERIADIDLSSIDLNEYVGEYYSEELSTTYQFVLDEGKLIARHNRHSDIPLTLAKLDFCSGESWFFSQVEFIREENNVIVGCKVSSGRVRNLIFMKK